MPAKTKSVYDPTLLGPGKLNAEPGSCEWAIAVRLRLQAFLNDHDLNAGHLEGSIQMMQETEGWRHLNAKNGLPFISFEQFAAEEEPFGLGHSVEQILEILKARTPTTLVDFGDRISKRSRGNPTGANQYKNGNLYNIQNSTSAPSGTSQAAALRRLREHRPDLHSKVLKGKLSAHSAMIKAGFRQKTLTVPLDPAKAAESIKRHFNEEQIAKLIALLLGAS